MPITDHFAGFGSGLESPATGLLVIAPSDGADLTVMPRALMVTQSGNVAVVMKDGSTGTLPALQAGVPYPIRVRRVLSTGTTATGIVGLY